jgi:hypothetical protein
MATVEKDKWPANTKLPCFTIEIEGRERRHLLEHDLGSVGRLEGSPVPAEVNSVEEAAGESLAHGVGDGWDSLHSPVRCCKALEKANLLADVQLGIAWSDDRYALQRDLERLGPRTEPASQVERFAKERATAKSHHLPRDPGLLALDLKTAPRMTERFEDLSERSRDQKLAKVGAEIEERMEPVFFGP